MQFATNTVSLVSPCPPYRWSYRKSETKIAACLPPPSTTLSRRAVHPENSLSLSLSLFLVFFTTIPSYPLRHCTARWGLLYTGINMFLYKKVTPRHTPPTPWLNSFASTLGALVAFFLSFYITKRGTCSSLASAQSHTNTVIIWLHCRYLYPR